MTIGLQHRRIDLQDRFPEALDVKLNRGLGVGQRLIVRVALPHDDPLEA